MASCCAKIGSNIRSMRILSQLMAAFLLSLLAAVSLAGAEDPPAGDGTSAEAGAEFRCRVELSYQWKRADAGEGGGAEDVLVKAIEARAVGESQARAALNDAQLKANREVLEACRIEHENVSSCLARKLEASQPVMQQLSFSSRQKLEEAIESDCKAVMGRCLGIKASEVVCSQPPQPTPAAAEGSDKKKSEAKGGKK